MRLIVGLGNPGREYIGTRHNIGFEVVDAFAQKMGLIRQADEFDRLAKGKFNALAMDGSMPLSAGPHAGGSEKLLLLKPTTYMNLSGRSVQAAMAFYNVTPDDVMIVLDDIALPCGRIRLRSGGSPGGHNGLKDIERALATSQYLRLRMGIDPPPLRFPQKDYVLGRFTETQQQLLEPAIARAVSALVMWIEKGLEPAMSIFNADEKG